MYKKIVYIDMDGVIVDFEDAIKSHFQLYPHYKEEYKMCPDEMPDIFKNPKPIEGAVEAIKKLAGSEKFSLFIATTTPWGNPEAATHKRVWIEKHFNELFKKKMFITHRKDLLIGDYLIDDREANGAIDFKGELLSFGWAYEKKVFNTFKNWDEILNKLLPEL